jgi:beta-ureidopropionase / N-carbamoyl-L-amino-acid hydrolase
LRGNDNKKQAHSEAESTTLEECASGAQVLLNAVLEYDRRIGG